MRSDELEALFDQQAAGYDAQWARMAPIRDSLLFLLESAFAALPAPRSRTSRAASPAGASWRWTRRRG